ncbi:YdcF family protein [Microbacterium sp. H1-D42]|uniref:YdcF family protein n=1 Tax=Microbacterium sp. H1-D42 TaxID=2925844 RepID=UPI001F5336F2|nr:YdcF family protein [Microbacterium sp. H1-D42]UNK69785.1 YdcF family protein [Microbacterium sp. H1-D42]
MSDPRPPRRAAMAVAAAACVAWLWAESIDLRANRRGLGAETGLSHRRRRTDAVVVLGYRNRGERANFVNRFRVRAGIRSLDPAASTSRLVLCGGAVGGETPEAIVMQKYAREELGFRGAIALDLDSRSTWENVTNAIPHIEHADTIKIVSNGPHAEMGREILWQQRPDLAARLVRGAEHRFGEAPVLKILSALRIVQARLSGSRVSRARAPR